MSSLPVVVAVDGTPDSGRALHWAVAEATLRRTALRIAHVRDHARVHDGAAVALPIDPVLDRVRAALEGRPGLPPLQYLTVRGTPGRALPRLGAEAQLLVVGARARGGFASPMFGSSGVLCARESPCPVVVVPHAHGTPGLAPVRPRVVLGLAVPSYDVSTVAFAFEEAARRDAVLQVLCAFPWTPRPVPDSTPDRAALTSDSTLDRAALTSDSTLDRAALTSDRTLDRTLDRAAETRCARLAELELAAHRVRYPDVPVEVLTAPGDPAGHLAAASYCADLVVVGRHSRRLPPGHLLGTVTNSVLQQSRCPVAVIPTEPEMMPAAI